MRETLCRVHLVRLAGAGPEPTAYSRASEVDPWLSPALQPNPGNSGGRGLFWQFPLRAWQEELLHTLLCIGTQLGQ